MMNNEEEIGGCFVGIILLVIICIIPIGCYGRSVVSYETVSGTIVERSYRPPHSDVNVGVTDKGDLAVSPSNTPEAWTVIVQVGNDVIPITVQRQQWAKLDKGMTISITRGVCRWFGYRDWEIK